MSLGSKLPCTSSTEQSNKWKPTLNIPWKDRCWSWSSNTLATWCEKLTLWKRAWYWERLRAGGRGGYRGWDGWMASLIQWTCIWANSGRQWRTGNAGMLQSMALQWIRQDLAPGQQQLHPLSNPTNTLLTLHLGRSDNSWWHKYQSCFVKCYI